MRIVVLAGGLSPERDESLPSGNLIANALRNIGYRVLLLDVYEGICVDESDFEHLFKDNTGAILVLSQNGEFIYLEANTLPGMTPTSLLPQEALACGISYEELCNEIVRAAIK